MKIKILNTAIQPNNPDDLCKTDLLVLHVIIIQTGDAHLEAEMGKVHYQQAHLAALGQSSFKCNANRNAQLTIVPIWICQNNILNNREHWGNINTF